MRETSRRKIFFVFVQCKRHNFHTSPVSYHTSHITHHTSHITHHTSHITSLISHGTHHTSQITTHTSHAIHLKKKRRSRQLQPTSASPPALHGVSTFTPFAQHVSHMPLMSVTQTPFAQHATYEHHKTIITKITLPARSSVAVASPQLARDCHPTAL